MHSMISLLLVAATRWQRASFAHIATVHMLSTAAAMMALTLPLCLAAQRFQQEQVLAYPLHRLDQKVMEPQPRVWGSGSHGTLTHRVTGAGPVLHGTRAGRGEHGGMRVVWWEQCRVTWRWHGAGR